MCNTNLQIKHYYVLYQPTYKLNTTMCYTNLQIKHYYVLYQPTNQTLICVKLFG